MKRPVKPIRPTKGFLFDQFADQISVGEFLQRVDNFCKKYEISDRNAVKIEINEEWSGYEDVYTSLMIFTDMSDSHFQKLLVQYNIDMLKYDKDMIKWKEYIKNKESENKKNKVRKKKNEIRNRIEALQKQLEGLDD